jgi:endonuclease YncB( thermonuclease family)
MRAHAPTLAVFSILSLAIVVATHAAPRQDVPGAPTIAPEARSTPAIAGTAEITDGDSIKINGIAIRLHGIDAAEMSQTCTAAPSATRFRVAPPDTWNCGLEARRALARLIGHAEVSCVETTIDRYGRTVARCRAGETDLNAEMVRQGQAWAFVKYSTDYVEIEKEARAARRGIWQADTQTAWDYRAGKWQAAQVNAPEGCTIKGNVTWTGERIYHLPWSPWYGTVKMDTASSHRKGKRWFCSEAEAMEAGWRPSATR